jgi:hypothetical protein
MVRTFFTHLRQQWMGGLALFLVLSGGTALATHETILSSDIVDEEVKAADIDNGAVRTFEIRDDNVQGLDILDNTIASADIQQGQVRSADVANENLTGTDVLNNSLTGDDVQESSLNLGGFFAATSPAPGFCGDNGGGGQTCVSDTITLNHPGKLLLNASGMWETVAFDDVTGANAGSDQVDLVTGRCDLEVDGLRPSTHGGNIMGERQVVAGAGPSHPAGVPAIAEVTALSDTLAAGPHNVAVECFEQDGDIDWLLSLTVAVVDH